MISTSARAIESAARLPEPELLDDRVTLGHEGAPLVERAHHCLQRPQPTECRRPGIAVGRVLEDREDAPPRLFDRRRSAPQQQRSQLVAMPSRKREPAACVLCCENELLFGVEPLLKVAVRR